MSYPERCEIGVDLVEAAPKERGIFLQWTGGGWGATSVGDPFSTGCCGHR